MFLLKHSKKSNNTEVKLLAPPLQASEMEN